MRLGTTATGGRMKTTKQDFHNSTTASVIESHINYHSTSVNAKTSSMMGANLTKSVDKTSLQL